MGITHTIPSNSIQTNVVGWTFDAPDETWINPGFTVSSVTNCGFINDNYADDTLDNRGTVKTFDPHKAAVLFDVNSGSATVINETNATISGARNGIDFQGSGIQTLNNSGTIFGSNNNGVFFDHGTLGISVVNNVHGYIFGPSYGLENASHNGGGTIQNFGVIKGGATPPSDNPSLPPAAISLFTSESLVTNIVNAAGATIDGAVDAIYANSGQFKLTNRGFIHGNVVNSSGGSEVIVNRGTIHGAIYLEGDSVFKDVGGGSSGPIHVGGGNSTITGGRGIDHFVFDSAITTQLTTITNFQHGIDKIVLSENEFATLRPGIHNHPGKIAFHVGAVAHTPAQHIVYDHAHGILYYDPNGSAGPQIEIAHFTNNSGMTYDDILIRA